MLARIHDYDWSFSENWHYLHYIRMCVLVLYRYWLSVGRSGIIKCNGQKGAVYLQFLVSVQTLFPKSPARLPWYSPLGNPDFLWPLPWFRPPYHPFLSNRLTLPRVTSQEIRSPAPSMLSRCWLCVVITNTSPSELGLTKTPSHFRFVYAGLQEMKLRRKHYIRPNPSRPNPMPIDQNDFPL